jgi:hypothetical protein
MISLPFGPRGALAWSFIRFLLVAGASTPPASKEVRMNNVPRNYN